MPSLASTAAAALLSTPPPWTPSADARSEAESSIDAATPEASRTCSVNVGSFSATSAPSFFSTVALAAPESRMSRVASVAPALGSESTDRYLGTRRSGRYDLATAAAPPPTTVATASQKASPPTPSERRAGA